MNRPSVPEANARPPRATRLTRWARWAGRLALAAPALGPLALSDGAGAAAGAAGCKREPPAAPSPLRVAAAADLANCFAEVGTAFERATGQPVTFSFGASGLLAKQIAEGAPFDVFAAANVAFVDDAVKSGACLGETKQLYAVGHLVVWSPSEAGVGAPPTLADLKDPRFRKIAIANPEHAPYGRAAKQALERAGLWEAVKDRIVYGENVQQAFAFARAGGAEVAIVARSLALAAGGVSTPVDTALHDRLDQALAVCRGAGGVGASEKTEAAKRFEAFVQSDEGHAILDRYGFVRATGASDTVRPSAQSAPSSPPAAAQPR